MAIQSPRQLYNAALTAGFQPPAALVLTEVEEAESHGDVNAVGDVSLEDARWGPSVGAPQIRTLKQATGSGGMRDISWLTGNLAHQQQAAYAISRSGTNFTPWSTYNDGKYLTYAASVRSSVGEAAGTQTLPISSGGLSGLAADWRDIVLQAGAGLVGAALLIGGGVMLARPQLEHAAHTAAKGAELAALL